ncbi:hypothetical protein [Streptomyces sp. NPDC093261]|uniref:hypothetical protein n=1 Tax=Streptomyces sp. NPDC093261 TaxID=3366037 RepID=UPI0037FF0D03
MSKQAIAGATVAVGMVLVMTACTIRESGQPHAATSSGASTTSQAVGKKAPKKCLTAQLKWTLTRLDEPMNKTSSHLAVAQLTATNAARRTCTFDGYPWLIMPDCRASWQWSRLPLPGPTPCPGAALSAPRQAAYPPCRSATGLDRLRHLLTIPVS